METKWYLARQTAFPQVILDTLTANDSVSSGGGGKNCSWPVDAYLEEQ